MKRLSYIIADVFSEEPTMVEEARTKSEAVNYLVGKVLQRTKGRADPISIMLLIIDRLKKNKVGYTNRGDIIVYVQLDKNENPLFVTSDESECIPPYAVDYVNWKRKYKK